MLVCVRVMRGEKARVLPSAALCDTRRTVHCVQPPSSFHLRPAAAAAHELEQVLRAQRVLFLITDHITSFSIRHVGGDYFNEVTT